MRLEEGLVNRVDLWRKSQKDQPSRAEAMRRLLDVGLSVAQPDEIYPSNSEKLIMYMISDIMKKVDEDGKYNYEINPDFIMKVISGGHYWALGWEMEGMFHGNIATPSAVQDVKDILDMWSFIEEAFEGLSDQEKSELNDSTAYSTPSFLGFDGNNESEHMAIARFMIDDLKNFQCFKNHSMSLNSHMPVLPIYLPMARKFEPIRKRLIGRGLSLNELKSLLSRNI